MFVIFLMLCYGFAGSLFFLVLSGCVQILARTRLGVLFSSALREHRATRARDPREALIGLSLVIAGLPILGGICGGVYLSTAKAMALKKHMGLVVAVSMISILIAVVAVVLLTFVVGRGIEWAIKRCIRREVTARALSSLWFLSLTTGLLLGIGAALAVSSSWHVLKLLNLRPLWIGLLWVVLTLPCLWVATRLVARTPRWRVAMILGTSLVGWFAILWSGSAAGVQKSAAAYSGLGGHLTRAYRLLGDWDRDGYSSLLGGGDCDDSDPDVHPAGVEIPDDGIDQNCVGGDASTLKRMEEPSFAARPADLPIDFNVLFLTIDTVRSDHFGSYGYERDTTPSLDALAKEGFLFTNSWAHAPSTRYSMPAILTGRYPLNVYYDYTVRGWPGLQEKATTIPEIMKEHGLTTGAIVNHWYFAANRRMNQGVDFYDNKNARLHKQSAKDGPAKSSGSSSQQQSDKAIRFIKKHAEQRFFLWVHYYDPHYEYERHEGIPSFGEQEIDLYDHEIRFTDHHINRVLKVLKEKKLYDKTVIVVTGDHGEGFGEHSIDLHGYHLYAAQTRVPLIIRVPGMKPGTVDTPAGHIDLLPTLANLVGAPPTESMMGRSLLGLMSGEHPDDEDRYIFQQLSYGSNNEMRAAASRNCHVIYNISPHNSWELYQIANDPSERHDVIDNPGTCSQAQERLAHWYDLSEIPPSAGDALLEKEPHLKDPISVQFGENILLREVLLPKHAVRPGDTIPITLTFQALGRLSGKWKVFMHLENGSHRVMGDHIPARPFSWWIKGQFIRYQRMITIPRSARNGRYQVRMGIYKGKDRQPVSSADAPHEEDRATVGSFRVRR